MENLRQLMAAYFHQDWWDEYGGSWERAVDDFARREPHRVSGARDDIRQLLDESGSDDAIGSVLDDLGNFRNPGAAKDANRAWLTEINQRLA